MVQVSTGCLPIPFCYFSWKYIENILICQQDNRLSSPIARSTPNTVRTSSNHVNQSPTTPSRTLSYVKSMLQKPSDLNKSISPRSLKTSIPRTSSGSLQNITNDKSISTGTLKKSFLRRKSAGDLKLNNLHRSVDTGKVPTGSKLPKISRSTSFQSKCSKCWFDKLNMYLW